MADLIREGDSTFNDPKTITDLAVLASLAREGLLGGPLDIYVGEPSETLTRVELNRLLGSTRWSEKGDRFIRIARRANGAMFCLWLYPGLRGRPPVVFFGGDGELHLVSANTTDFLHQLSSGYLYWRGHWIVPTDGDAVRFDWQALRVAVNERLGVDRSDPNVLTTKAERRNPAFRAWATARRLKVRREAEGDGTKKSQLLIALTKFVGGTTIRFRQ